MLVLDLDEVEVSDGELYPIAGVYNFGRGVFARNPLTGSETSYKKFLRLHAGQLIMSRLKAFEGAIAVVPSEFDGFFVSKEFPTFRCVEDVLDPRYLALLCRWKDFWERLASTSVGIGARRERVHVDRFLNLRLDVPEVEEQQSIADRLNRVLPLSEQIKQLTNRADQIATSLATSVCTLPHSDASTKSREGWTKVRLSDLMSLSREQVSVTPMGNYPNVGIYSFGRGLFAKPDIDGASTSAKTLNRIHADQFIYSRLFAFEGAYACVPPEFDGHFVSNEFPTFDTDSGRLNTEWLVTALRSPDRWAELAGSSRGLGMRRQRIPVEAVLAYEMWIPPIQEQQQMVQTVSQLNHAAACRTSQRERLDALVPAALNESLSRLS